MKEKERAARENWILIHTLLISIGGILISETGQITWFAVLYIILGFLGIAINVFNLVKNKDHNNDNN